MNVPTPTPTQAPCNIVNIAGRTVQLVTEGACEIAPNMVYLDGAYRGTVLGRVFEGEPALSWSFDHHAPGQERFSTSATCQQVLSALLLGADLSTQDIQVSSIDADSVLSLFMVLRPDVVKNHDFAALVREVAQVDANGPAAADPGVEPYKLFSWLRPDRGEAMSTELLLRKVESLVRAYEDKSIYDRAPAPKQDGTAITLTPAGDAIKLKVGKVSFGDVYETGAFGLLMGDKITIGKLPFAPVKPLTSLWPFLTDRFNIGKWGGADTIGGSPFAPTGNLPGQEALLNAIRDWLKN